MSDKIKVLFGTMDTGGCNWYRGYMPLAYLSDEGLIDGYVSNSVIIPLYFGGEERMLDVVGIQRPYLPKSLRFLDDIKPVMYIDVDDNFFDLPYSNVCYHDFERMKNLKKNPFDPCQVHKTMLSNSNIVTVSTEELKQAIHKVTGRNNMAVIPNCIFDIVPEGMLDAILQEKFKSPKIKIGWYGGPHHWDDWNGYDEALLEFYKKNRYKCELSFIGWAPPKCLESGIVPAKPWVPIYNFYAELLRSDFDIIVAPLADNPFNRCKSNIKFLETGMFKRCFMGQKSVAYQDVEHGKTGLLFSTPEEMVEQLETLTDNRATVNDMGRNAYKFVMEKYHIREHAFKWLHIFKMIKESSEDWKLILSDECKEQWAEDEPKIIEAFGIEDMFEYGMASLKNTRSATMNRRNVVLK